MQISDAMRLAARKAFKACRPVERVACQDFGMQQDDILDQQLEAALQAALAGHVVVPFDVLFNAKDALEQTDDWHVFGTDNWMLYHQIDVLLHPHLGWSRLPAAPAQREG